MATAKIDIHSEARSRHLLMALLILVALLLSLGVAIQRSILTEGFVPAAFAAGTVPGAGLAGTGPASSYQLTSAIRFDTPFTVRRSIPGRDGLLGGGLFPGLLTKDPIVAAITPSTDGDQPLGVTASDSEGLTAPPGPAISGASSESPGGPNPFSSAPSGSLGGGGAILPSNAFVPEPDTWVLMILGVFALGLRLRLRRHSTDALALLPA